MGDNGNGMFFVPHTHFPVKSTLFSVQLQTKEPTSIGFTMLSFCRRLPLGSLPSRKKVEKRGVNGMLWLYFLSPWDSVSTHFIPSCGALIRSDLVSLQDGMTRLVHWYWVLLSSLS